MTDLKAHEERLTRARLVNEIIRNARRMNLRSTTDEEALSDLTTEELQNIVIEQEEWMISIHENMMGD